MLLWCAALKRLLQNKPTIKHRYEPNGSTPLLSYWKSISVHYHPSNRFHAPLCVSVTAMRRNLDWLLGRLHGEIRKQPRTPPDHPLNHSTHLLVLHHTLTLTSLLHILTKLFPSPSHRHFTIDGLVRHRFPPNRFQYNSPSPCATLTAHPRTNFMTPWTAARFVGANIRCAFIHNETGIRVTKWLLATNFYH